MPPRTIPGNTKLAKQMKSRRNELNLTIEEAALRAGVGTKTWSRYEAGASIRQDKCKGICKALSWRNFPDGEDDVAKKSLLEEWRQHEAWSSFLEDTYGAQAALDFATGSDVLLDYIEQDQSELRSMPLGSHIGQLSMSLISEELPPQFLMRYDYDFLYHMQCVLLQLRKKAKSGTSITAHSILEKLIFYLCNEEALVLLEVCGDADNFMDDEHLYTDTGDNWVFDMFDDMDIITFLYSNVYLEEDHPFHFKHWHEQQFYMEDSEKPKFNFHIDFQ